MSAKGRQVHRDTGKGKGRKGIFMQLAFRITVVQLAMATLGGKLIRGEPINFREVEAVAQALREYEQLSKCPYPEIWQDIYRIRDYIATQGGKV